jgi:hypothetical protein
MLQTGAARSPFERWPRWRIDAAQSLKPAGAWQSYSNCRHAGPAHRRARHTADRGKSSACLAKAIADPDLLAEAAKQGWDVDPTKGEELQALSKEVITQPKEIIERMKWVLGRE